MAIRLTYEQFAQSCIDFISISEAIVDSWQMEEVEVEGGQSIVHIKRRTQINVTDFKSCEADCDFFDKLEEYNEEIETSCNFDEDRSEYRDSYVPVGDSYSVDHEVHYNMSYGVPVLYSRFWDSGGQTLPLSKVWSMFSPSQVRVMDRVSMAPHPLTDTPWVQVHPCMTADISGEMLSHSPDQNYLVTFLSLYGQAVGLRLSEKFAQQQESQL